jgi:hypothetical protein
MTSPFRAVLATGLALGVSIVYVARLNDVAGLMVDDAYYILLGKALAEGKGYRIISSGATAMLPLYPPGFPLVLSPIFRIAPDFPGNVWLLKSISIAAMFATSVLTYGWCRQQRMAPPLAACAAMLIALCPAFVFLATSTVMSECLFTLAQLAAVFAIQRSGQVPHPRGTGLVVLGAVMGASAMLMRSAGAAVLVTAGLWLVKEREWKRASMFAAVAAVCLLPWLAYSHAHAPTREERVAHGGSIAYEYQEQLWMRWAGTPGYGTATVADLPARVATNLEDIFARGFGGIFVPALFRGPSESGEELVSLGGAVGIRMGSMGSAGATKVISTVIGFVVMLGFVVAARRQATVAELLVPVSVVIILIWPFWSFRFLLPLTPFLIVYLVAGITTLAAWVQRSGRAAVLAPAMARMALLCLIGLSVLDHVGYIVHARNGSRLDGVPWLAQAREIDSALAWLNAHTDGGVVATTNPALVYLRTGRKTVSFDGSLPELLARKGDVHVVACFVPVQAPETPELRLVHTSPGGLWIGEIRNDGMTK